MRIAFITSEFVTELSDGGGLGNYLNRMGCLLCERGHEVEIFVPSQLEPGTLMHNGIRVERVRSSNRELWLKGLGKLLAVFPTPTSLRQVFSWFAQSRRLAAAMEYRHREKPFDVVQSADYLAVGLSIRKKANRMHVIRCSTAIDLYNAIDGRTGLGAKYQEKMELSALRRADIVYAPSRFVADHYQAKYGLTVKVVRPPVAQEVPAAGEPPLGLPAHYFVHFGQLTRRKGTPWLAEAFKLACDEEPSLRMVWVGQDYYKKLAETLSLLGEHRSKILTLQPLPKRELYAVLQQADAAVLPSLVDNLPNTVIESLMLGLPVIGTRGASIDELVEEGVTGLLVEPGNARELASAIVAQWRGETPVKKGFAWHDGLATEFQQDRAVENFLTLVKGSPCRI